MFSTSKQTFESIYKISTFSLLTPKWNFKFNRPIKSSLTQQFIVSVLILIPLILYGLQIGYLMYTFNEEKDKMSRTITVFNEIIFFLLCSTIIFSRSNKKWHKLLYLIQQNSFIYDMIDFNRKTRLNKNPMFLQFCIGSLLSFIKIGVIGPLSYSHIKFDKILVWMYIASISYLVFIISLFTSLMFNVLITIEFKLKKLILSLRKLNINIYQDQRYINLKQIQYRKILDICDIFNDLFGKHILFLIFYTCTQLLDAFTDALNYIKHYDNDEKRLINAFMGIINLVKMTKSNKFFKKFFLI